MKHLLKRYREGCYHPQELGNSGNRQTTLVSRRNQAAKMRRSDGNLPMHLLPKHDDTHASEAGMESHLVQREAQPVKRMRRIGDLNPLDITGSAIFRGIILGWI
jgi:hypothetical protein